jgi:hypothetical protein
MNPFHRIRHWSPHYVVSRIKVESFRRRHGGPNLAIGAITFLVQWLKPTDLMLEYGSGFSTAWFGQRVSKLISVENDPVWFSRVRQQLATHNITNVELKLLNQGPRLEGAAVGADYLSVLLRHSPDSFDIILNDGWARPHIATRTDLVRPGGLFIWDDYSGAFPIHTRIPGSLPVDKQVENPMLLDFMKRTAHWRKVIYDDGVHSTALFFRPAC